MARSRATTASKWPKVVAKVGQMAVAVKGVLNDARPVRVEAARVVVDGCELGALAGGATQAWAVEAGAREITVIIADASATVRLDAVAGPGTKQSWRVLRGDQVMGGLLQTGQTGQEAWGLHFFTEKGLDFHRPTPPDRPVHFSFFRPDLPLGPVVSLNPGIARYHGRFLLAHIRPSATSCQQKMRTNPHFSFPLTGPSF